MWRRGAVTAGAAALALVSALLSTGAAGATSSDTGGAHQVGPRTSRVLLPTGDTVKVTAGSGPDRIGVIPRSASGIAGHFTTTRLGDRTYVIPGVAGRYLGVLDRSLFEITDSGSVTDVPVALSVQSGTSPDVPGLTVTSRTASAWRGHFTAAGAREFGAALTRQWTEDAAANRVSTTLFGGVTRMAQPGVRTGATPVVQPQFPQQTLTITVLGRNGKPVKFAEVALTNVDDGTSKYTDFVDVVDGVAKVSVPTGTYSGLATVDVYAARARTFTTYFVPVEEVEVGSASSSMVFDTRLATVRPAVHTPRPAGLTALNLEWDRFSGRGGISSGYGFEGSRFKVFVAPSGQATKGTLNWLTEWQLAGQPTDSLPYTYDLAFRDAGRVPAEQDHTVVEADLARVDARYYSDAPGRTSGLGRTAVYPFQFFVFYSFTQQPASLARTEYLYAPSSAKWLSAYYTLADGGEDFGGELDVDDAVRTYQNGSTYGADWLRGPLGPGIAPPLSADQRYFCGYCRTDTSLFLGLAGLSDSTLGHFGYFFPPDEDTVLTHFRLYRDGELIDDQDNYTGDQVTVEPGSATYRAVVDTTRGLLGFRTSTTARTEVTVVSSSTSGSPAPSRWICPEADEGGEGGQAAAEGCTVLPVMLSQVPLPTDLGSTMPLGSVPVDFTVDHAVGAADPAITAVSVELTYDGGKTYVAMPVSRISPHHYRTTLRNPPSVKGKAIGFRLTATDAAGGELAQTAQAAYVAAQS